MKSILRLRSLHRLGLPVAYLTLGAVAGASLTILLVPQSAGTGQLPPNDLHPGGAPVIATSPAPGEPAKPVRLEIPALKIDAPVESVGRATDGSMDVPRDVHDVAWYKDGPIPGDPGDAVIDGHLGYYSNPTVFSKLSQIEVGDEVDIVLADGTTRAFTVMGVTRTPYNTPPAGLFATTGPPRVTLITCSGDWDPNRQTNLQRLLVQTRPDPYHAEPRIN